MKYALLTFCFLQSLATNIAHANDQIAEENEIYLMSPSKEVKVYSKKDLHQKIWELERAVFQLQQKVFQLEIKDHRNSAKTEEKTPSWICKVKGMGETFSAVGINKALAEQAALDKCQNANPIKSTAKCSEAVCSQ